MCCPPDSCRFYLKFILHYLSAVGKRCFAAVLCLFRFKIANEHREFRNCLCNREMYFVYPIDSGRNLCYYS